MIADASMYSNYADQCHPFDEKDAYDYIDDDVEVKKDRRDKKEVRFCEDSLGGVKKKKLKSIRMTKATKLSGASIIQTEDEKKLSGQQGGTSLSKKKKSSKRSS